MSKMYLCTNEFLNVNMTTAFHNIPDYVSTESTLSPSVIESLASTCKCSFTTCNEKSISRCTQCFEYYCYNHAYGHIHSIEHFEILK